MPCTPFHPSEKIPLIAAYAQQRPATWIDDLHSPEAHVWAARRTSPTLLITTDPAIGLTRDSIDRVITWARPFNNPQEPLGSAS